MTTIKLDLEIKEIDFILEALGEMPTKTNAFNLVQKILAQGAPQVPDELRLKPIAE
jgi:hypothetical protein